MKEIIGDIWSFHDKGWIVVTTNGTVKNNGACVMGRGIALQAAQKFPALPFELGKFLKDYGNILLMFGDKKLLTFPVKHNWWEKADLNLIERSAKELAEFNFYLDSNIYLTRVGCGNGKLLWEDVKPVLEKYLISDRFIVVRYSDVA